MSSNPHNSSLISQYSKIYAKISNKNGKTGSISSLLNLNKASEDKADKYVSKNITIKKPYGGFANPSIDDDMDISNNKNHKNEINKKESKKEKIN